MSSPSSSSSSSSAGSPGPAAPCPFRNWSPPAPNPTPSEVMNLSQRIDGFVENYIPLTGDGCLKRVSGCPSCPPGACVHSGGGEPMLDFCHCWTCCFGKPTGNSMRAFYIDVKEYARVHGNACAAHSLLKSGIDVAKVSKQYGELSEEEKEKMQRCCQTEISASYKRHVSITRRTRSMMHLADNIRDEGILEGMSGQILDLWHAAPEDTNPEDAQTIWVKTRDGERSPFCFARCLNYLRTIRCYRTNTGHTHNFLFKASPGSSIASCVMYTLAAIIKNENFRDLLLEEEDDGAGGTIYTCSYELIKIILLLSIVARGKHPHAGFTDQRRQFEEEDEDTIRLASNAFRERILGKFIFDRHGTQIPQALLREFPTLSMNMGLKPWSRVTSTQPDPSTIFGEESSGEEEEMPETPPPPQRRRRQRRQTPRTRPSSSKESLAVPVSSDSSDSSSSHLVRPPESSPASTISTRRLSVSSISTLITVEENPEDYTSDIEQLAATYPISIFVSPPPKTPEPGSPTFRITSSPLPSPVFSYSPGGDGSPSTPTPPRTPTISPRPQISPEREPALSEKSFVLISDSEGEGSTGGESVIPSPITISSDSSRSIRPSSRASSYLTSYIGYESNSEDSQPMPITPSSSPSRSSCDLFSESSTSEATPSTPKTPQFSPWEESSSPESQDYTGYFSDDSGRSTPPPPRTPSMSPRRSSSSAEYPYGDFSEDSSSSGSSTITLASPGSPLSSTNSLSPRILRTSSKTSSVMLGSPCSYEDSKSTTPTSSPRRSPVFSYVDDHTSSSGSSTITLASPGTPYSPLAAISSVSGSSIPGSSSDDEQEEPAPRASVIQTAGAPRTGSDEGSSRKRSADSESSQEGTSSQQADQPSTSSTTTPGDRNLPPKKRWRNWQPT
ncbi:hypothetical protein [Chlamydia sp. 04-14]|uniref:hypothetical protein n=1 Tax=Chlamydia TaxID=810 RepID=UPI002FC9416B